MNYQEKVSTRADVRALYERVRANPAIRLYRGYTDSKSYGWDAAADEYVKKDGEVWFENPAYDATYVPEGAFGGEEAELLDEKLAEREAQLAELEKEVGRLEEESEALKCRVIAAEAAVTAAEQERDSAKDALVELRRALARVGELIAN